MTPPARAVRERSLLAFHLRARRDPLGYVARCANEDGDLVVFALGPARMVFVSDPHLAEEVLVRRTREFVKAHTFESDLPWARKILGHGLLMSEGPEWLRQRRLMQPAFHREKVASYDGLVIALTDRCIASWRPGVALDVYAAMRRLVVEIMAAALFGAAADAAAMHDALHDLFDHRPASRGLLNLLPEWLPTPANVRTRAALGRLDRSVYELIAQRRRAPGGADLLSLLIEARDEDGGAFTDEQIRDEIMSTVVAGHDTLAATLAWTFDLLARRPDVEASLVGALARPAGAAEGPAAALDPLLDRVVREILRLFPPGRSVVRVTAAASELGGLPLPRGAFVVMSQWVLQRDGRYYERPDEFEADRWTDGLAQRLPRCAYFPFGAGPRLCLGAPFAERVLRVVLARALPRLRLALADPSRTVWDPATLRPRGGLWMVPGVR